MSSTKNVLERSVLESGKVFIRAGEEILRAYVIQSGEVSAFTTLDGKKVEVTRFGPGTIIGETGLMIDEESKLSYEALNACTVITITRQDFQKRLARADKSITTILDHAVKKILYYEDIQTDKALSQSDIDETAIALMNSLLQGVTLDRKLQYEDAILPHVNDLIKAIKELKSKPEKNHSSE